jgi:hypothetical protein
LQIPLDSRIKELADIPYTISFIIRKRQQIDNLNELGKDKRPPESIVWDAPPEELDEWLEKMFDPKTKGENMIELKIKPSEIEG